MSNSIIVKKVQEDFLQEGREQIKTGMEIEVSIIIKENDKERVQKFK
jgi:ribosomal protein L19